MSFYRWKEKHKRKARKLHRKRNCPRWVCKWQQNIHRTREKQALHRLARGEIDDSYFASILPYRHRHSGLWIAF